MKKVVIALILFCLSITLYSQENDLVLSYDASGNIIERKIQVVMVGRIGKFDELKIAKDSTLVDNFSEIKIYPNPANTYLNIEGRLPENVAEARLRLINSSGVILKTDFYVGQLKTINVSSLSNGLYILEMQYSKKEAKSFKVIISN